MYSRCKEDVHSDTWEGGGMELGPSQQEQRTGTRCHSPEATSTFTAANTLKTLLSEITQCADRALQALVVGTFNIASGWI
jgi:hypothetical protein